MSSSALRNLVAALFCAVAAGCSDDPIIAAPSDLAPYPDGWVVDGHPFAAYGQATLRRTDDMTKLPAGWAVFLADESNGCGAFMLNAPTTTYLWFLLPENPVGILNVDKSNVR